MLVSIKLDQACVATSTDLTIVSGHNMRANL